MAKLAYCKKCRATYPLSIVSGDARSQREGNKPLTCPFGHTGLRAVEDLEKRGKK
jgi:hypothetical protein